MSLELEGLLPLYPLWRYLGISIGAIVIFLNFKVALLRTKSILQGAHIVNTMGTGGNVERYGG